MLQRTAGTFIAKKIKDEFFAPPPPDDDEEDRAPQRSQPQHYDDPQDGAEFVDENGHVVGYLRRVHDIAVYAVTTAHGSPHAALIEALRDPDSQLSFQSTNGRVSALIYAPDPERQQVVEDTTPRKGFRADDV